MTAAIKEEANRTSMPDTTETKKTITTREQVDWYLDRLTDRQLLKVLCIVNRLLVNPNYRP